MNLHVSDSIRTVVFCAVMGAALLLPSASVNAQVPVPGVVEVQHCADVQVEVRGFGAGLMHQPMPIEPTTPSVVRSSTTEQCAAIAWSTPIIATSQVVFAPVGTQPTVPDLEAERFGYPYATTQNASGVAQHTAILKNLVPGTTYVYRVVTRAHPTAVPHITNEMFFTFTGGPVAPSTTVPVVPVYLTPTTNVVAPPTVGITATTTQPSVTYTTTEVAVTETVIVPTESTTSPVTMAVSATTTTVGTQPSPEALPLTPADLPLHDLGITAGGISALSAANDAMKTLGKDTTEGTSTFMSRLAQAFSFGNQSTVARDTAAVAQTTETKRTPKTSEKPTVSMSGKGLFVSDKYIVPALFFLVLLYLLQQLVLPALGIVVERPLVFWMLGVIAIAVFAGLLQLFYVTIFMLALFLALLAWYILELFDEPETQK